MRRIHSDDFDHARFGAFLRMKAQASFRNEPLELTFDDWCAFWSTPELWQRRGRGSSDLSFFRIDQELPWHRDNCCLIPRKIQMAINANRKVGRPWDHLLEEAIRV